MAYLMRSALKLRTPGHLLKISGDSCVKHVELLSTSAFAMWQKQDPAHGSGTAAGDTKTSAQKKSKEYVAKITLIQNNNMTVTGLEDARNLAKRRSMHLVQVQQMDTKTQRPVYKLLTSAEKLQEELSELTPLEKYTEKSNQKKSVKNLNIGSRIFDNDLASRIKNISKWLGKHHEVRVLIQGSQNDTATCEKVFKAIESSVQSPETIGKIVQKRNKGSVIKFNILPITPSGDNKESSPTQ